MELKNKVVLVTGASGGMGKAIAHAFQQQSSHVIKQYHTSSLKDKYAIKVDLRKQDEIKKMFQYIKKEFGKLDILIYAAGLEEAFDDQLDTSFWQDTFQVNLFGPIECARNAIELFGKNEGLIINTASIFGNKGVVCEEALAYSVSKAALQKFSENLALMYAPTIRVVCVSPGYVITSMWDKFSEKEKKDSTNSVPLKRFIMPEEIATFMVDIARSKILTGGNLVVDAGLYLKKVI